LSAAEFEAVLSSLDGDNDGQISLKEFEAFVNNADDLMHAILEVGSARRWSRRSEEFNISQSRVQFLKSGMLLLYTLFGSPL